MKLLFRKQLGALRPTDEEGEAALSKIANGDFVMLEFKRPRNVAHHRLFFALLNIVYANQDRYDNVKSFRTAFTIALGWFDTVFLPDGKVGLTPKSISFAAMDQTAFNVFFDDAVRLVCEKWLPTVTSEELKREIHEMIGLAA